MELGRIRTAAMLAVLATVTGCGAMPTTPGISEGMAPADPDALAVQQDVNITFTGQAPRRAIITVVVGDNNVTTVQVGRGNTVVSQTGTTGSIVQVGQINSANSVTNSTNVVATNNQAVQGGGTAQAYDPVSRIPKWLRGTRRLYRMQ